MLLYDRETDSLWSQVLSKGVTGEMTGRELVKLPSTLTTWKRWVKRHPDTFVLSKETGYERNYERDPYESYYRSPFSLLPIGQDRGLYRFKEKEPVLGVTIKGKRKVYPFREIKRHGKRSEGTITLEDTFEGVDLVVTLHIFKEASGKDIGITRGVEGGATASTSNGTKGSVDVESMQTYWFIWYLFYPESVVFTGEKGR